MPLPLLASVKTWARHIKRDVVAVYFAARDPRTPLAVRCLAWAVAAYALSPIDLIPDFIPILGYLDDLLLVPLGLALVIRLVPAAVMLESRQRAMAVLEKPQSRIAAALIIFVWLLAAAAVLWFFGRAFLL